jgi:hypothetical protein
MFEELSNEMEIISSLTVDVDRKFVAPLKVALENVTSNSKYRELF